MLWSSMRNNLVEADDGLLKARLRRELKQFRSVELGQDLDPRHRLPRVLTELARAV